VSRDFDGVDDLLRIDSPVDTQTTFTVAFWLNPDGSSSSYQGLVTEGTTQGILWRASEKITFFYSSADHQTTNEYESNEWHHFAASVSAGSLTFYRDGVANGTSTLVPAIAFDFIGNTNAGGEDFDGEIADVRIWDNLALSAEEIVAVMHGVIVRPDQINTAAGGWFPLFGTTSPEPDFSGRNKHVTVTEASRGDHPPQISAIWPNANQVLVTSVTPSAGNLLLTHPTRMSCEL